MIAWPLFALLTLVALASYKPAESQRTDGFNGFALVDKAGNIQKPTDYRDHYQVLGHMLCWIRRETKCTSPMPLPVPSITASIEGSPMARCW
jgi:hypothetical protein